MLKSFRSFIAVLLSATLIFGAAAGPLAESALAESFRAPRPAKPPRADVFFPSEPASAVFGPPSNLGSLREIYAPLQQEPGPWRLGPVTLPFITHIQDAHENLAAQQALAGLIKNYARQSRSGEKLLVCVEGAWGAVETDWLKNFPDPAVRDAAAAKLLAADRLTGEEFVAITEPESPIEIIGVEDERLHRANERARQDSAQARAWMAPRIDHFKSRLARQKTRVYTARLRRLDGLTESYDANRLHLTDYLSGLKSLWLGRWPADQYPSITQFLRLNAWETSDGTVRVQRELNAARPWMAKLTLPTSRDPRVLLESLLVGLENVPGAPKMPACREYQEILKATQRLDPDGLTMDVEQLIQDLSSQGNVDAPAKRLWNLSAWTRHYERLWTLKLTPDEWRQVSADKRTIAWAERELASLSGEPALSEIAEPYWMSWGEARLRRFYQAALKRNEAMVKNTLAAISSRGVDHAVLIAGGFHTPGLAHLMRQVGVGHAVVCPIFKMPTAATLRQASAMADPAKRQGLARAFLEEARLLRGEKAAAELGRSWRRAIPPAARAAIPLAQKPAGPPATTRLRNAASAAVRTAGLHYRRVRQTFWGTKLRAIATLAATGAAGLLAWRWGYSGHDSAAVINTPLILLATLFPGYIPTSGLWSGEDHRPPLHPNGLTELAGQAEELTRLLDLAKTNPLGQADAENMLREIVAGGSERGSAVFLALDQAHREVVIHTFDTKLLGRILEGMTRYFFQRHLGALRSLRVTLIDALSAAEDLTSATGNEAREAGKSLRAALDALPGEVAVVQEALHAVRITPSFPSITDEEEAKEFKTAAASLSKDLDSLSVDNDADWATLIGVKTQDKLSSTAKAMADRLDGLLEAVEAELLSFGHPYIAEQPLFAAQRATALIYALRNRETRALQRVLIGAAGRQDEIGHTRAAADRMKERLGDTVTDLTREAEDKQLGLSLLTLSPDNTDFGAALDEIESALAGPKPWKTASLVVASDHHKGPLLRALAERWRRPGSPFRGKRLISVDMLRIFSDPERNRDVYTVLAEDAKVKPPRPGLLRDAAEMGDVVLAIDMDAFQKEDLPVLDRMLEYWSALGKSEREPPPIIAVAAETTARVSLDDSRSFGTFFEATAAAESETGSIALLAAEILPTAARRNRTVSSPLLERILRTVQGKTPYDRHAMALRLLETALSAVPDSPSLVPLEWEAIEEGIAALPSLDLLPLEDQLWAKKDDLPVEIRDAAIAEARTYTKLAPHNPRRAGLADYLRRVATFPYNKFSPPLVPPGLPEAETRRLTVEAIRRFKAVLEENHSGQEDAKKLFLRFFVQWLRNQNQGNRNVRQFMLLLGDPGVGKTSLGKALAQAFGANFQVIPLGGVDDDTTLVGHRRTYVDSRPGAIAEVLRRAGVRDPLVLLDELDKMGTTHGDPYAIFLVLLDPSQNNRFPDRFMGDIPANNIIFVLTANTLELPPELVDRLTVVPLAGYSTDERIRIALKHLIPRVRAELVIDNEVGFAKPKAVIRQVVKGYTREQGVRQLLRRIRHLYVRALRQWIEHGRTVLVDHRTDPPGPAPGVLAAGKTAGTNLFATVESLLGPAEKVQPIPVLNEVGVAVIPARSAVAVLRAATDTKPGLRGETAWSAPLQEGARLAQRVVKDNFAAWRIQLGLPTESHEPAPGVLLEASMGIGEEDSSRRLGFTLAILSAMLDVPLRRDAAFLGEVELDKGVGPVTHLRDRTVAAREAGTRFMFLSEDQKQSLWQDLFLPAPFLRGPVLDLAEGELRLPLYTPSVNASQAEIAGIRNWNDAVKALYDQTTDRSRVENEITLRADGRVLSAFIGGLPFWEGQLTYILINNPLQAARLTLLTPGSEQILGPTEATRPAWQDEDSSVETPPVRLETPPLARAAAVAVESIRTARAKTPWLLGEPGKAVDADVILTDLANNLESVQTLLKALSESLAAPGTGVVALRQVEEVLRGLIRRQPDIFARLTIGLIRSQNPISDLRDDLIKNASPSVVGEMLANYRAFALRNKRTLYVEQARTAGKHAENLVDRASFEPGTIHKTRAAFAAFMAWLEEPDTLITHRNIPGAADHLLEPLQRLKDLAPKLAATEDAEFPTLFRGAVGDIAEITNFIMDNALDYAVPEMTEQVQEIQDQIEDTIDMQVSSLASVIFPVLDEDPQAADRTADIWRAFLAFKEIDAAVKRERLASAGARQKDLPEDFTASFDPAMDAVKEMLERPNYRAITLLCPSEPVKELVPAMLQSHLEDHRIFRRVVSIVTDNLPVEPTDALREVLRYVDMAQRAGNVVLLLNLDEFQRRFADARVRSMARVLGRWRSEGKSVPLVFLSSEDAHADLSENLPAYFRRVPSKAIRFERPRAFLEYEVQQAAKRGESVSEEAKEWLGAAFDRQEMDPALATILIKDAASIARRDGRPVLVEDIEKARQNLLTEQTARTKEERLLYQIRTLPPAAREEAFSLLAQFKNAPETSVERGNLQEVLETMLKIPWRRRSPRLLPDFSGIPEDRRREAFREEARRILTEVEADLNESHYGMESAKEAVLDLVVERLQREFYGLPAAGKVICLVGPHGVGKTSLGLSLAKAFRRPLYRISLGGMRDTAELRGHSRTYQGAKAGKLVDAQIQMGVIDGIILGDEVDKIRPDLRGNPADVLMQVTDPEQNSAFHDHYAGTVDFSHVDFIFTANYIDRIPPPLRDRMDIIQIDDYSRAGKIQIGLRLLKRIMADSFVGPEDIVVPESEAEAVIAAVLDVSKDVAGVRELERNLYPLVQDLLTESMQTNQRPGILNVQRVKTYFGETRDSARPRARAALGHVNALAVIGESGRTIDVHARLADGPNPRASLDLSVFGLAKDQMLSSIANAVSYLSKRAAAFGLPENFTDGKQLAVSISHGDVVKQGPSAGVAFVTAIASVFLKRPVRDDLAMTGQINVSGGVEKVGGIPSKLQAALGYGMRTIILPAGNKDQLLELFASTPEVGGVVQEKGVQTLTVFHRKTLANIPPDDAYESAWAARRADLEKSAATHGVMVAVEAQTQNLVISGNRQSMQAFVQDPVVANQVTVAATYVLVYDIGEVLEEALLPEETPPTPPDGFIGGGLAKVVALFMVGWGALEAATYVSGVQTLAESHASVLAMGLLSFGPIRLRPRLPAWHFGRKPSPTTARPSRLNPPVPVALEGDRVSFGTPADIMRLGAALRRAAGVAGDDYPRLAGLFAEALRLGALQTTPDNERLLKELTTALTEGRRQSFTGTAGREAADDTWLLALAFEQALALIASAKLFPKQSIMRRGWEVIKLVFQALRRPADLWDRAFDAMAHFRRGPVFGGTLGGSAATGLPLGAAALVNQTALIPWVDGKAKAVVFDAALLGSPTPDVRQAVEAAVQNARVQNDVWVAFVSLDGDARAVGQSLRALGIEPPARAFVLGRGELGQGVLIPSDRGDRVSADKLASLFQKLAGSGDGFRLQVWADQNNAWRWAGELTQLLLIEQEVLLEGDAAQAFAGHMRALYGDEEGDRLLRGLADGTGRYRLAARSPLLADTVRAIEKDLLIQTQA